MAEHIDPRTTNVHDLQAPARAEAPVSAQGQLSTSAYEVSLGFVVEESDPGSARELCEAVTAAVPAGVAIEFLVLDDHTNPQRRELVREVDTRGDSARLVPRPAERTAELDAVSLSASSEFIVLSSGCAAPWAALPRALEELWADGADVAVVGRVGRDVIHSDDDSRRHHELVRRLGLPDRGSRPVGSEKGWFVLLRRWVARWLFSDPVRETDVQHEIATRAGLLGLQMLILDLNGAPVERT